MSDQNTTRAESENIQADKLQKKIETLVGVVNRY